MSMDPIGGYFSLELSHLEEFHSGAIALNTGRNCLEYILRSRGYHKVYIPYYTCDVVLQPFHKLGVEYEFYHIDEQLEIAEDIVLGRDEALMYTNYFGLKQQYVEYLSERYGQHLIIDNTQAFYARSIAGADTFYTCRKFFGVPDGAYLYTNAKVDFELEQDVSYDRMSFLLKRLDLGAEAGYSDFREQSERLAGQPIKLMSKLTKRLMQSIDYHTDAQRRRDNFNYLHQHLANTNQLQLTLGDEDVPMVYPYFCNDDQLREKLIDNKVFVARYWPNVLQWTSAGDLEYRLALQIQPLPLDQRYEVNDMDWIIKTVLF